MGIVIGHGGRIVIRLPYAPQAAAERERSWPLDARLAMFVLEAQASESSADDDGAAGDAEPAVPHQTRRRRDDRLACRFEAALLYPTPATANALSQNGGDESTIAAVAATAYVRDLSPGHAGFICREPLQAGQLCWLRLDQADGSNVTLRGIVGRCRAFMEGWSEGVVRFATEADEQQARNALDADEHLLRVAV
jgi:hypothetical protein